MPIIYNIQKVLVGKRLDLNKSKHKKILSDYLKLREEKKLIDERLDFRYNYYLYQIYEQKSYLQLAFNDVNENVNKLKPLKSKKFLNQISTLHFGYRSVFTWYMWRSIDPVDVEY